MERFKTIRTRNERAVAHRRHRARQVHDTDEKPRVHSANSIANRYNTPVAVHPTIEAPRGGGMGPKMHAAVRGDVRVVCELLFQSASCLAGNGAHIPIEAWEVPLPVI